MKRNEKTRSAGKSERRLNRFLPGGAGIKKGFPGKPFVLGIAGLAVCHAFGVVQFSIVTGNTIPASFLAVSVPYIVKDVISVVVAEILGVAVRKALSAAHVMNYGTAA